MENFGLQEFDDLGSYCTSHRLLPDEFGDMVQAYKNHRIPRLWLARSVTRFSPTDGRLFLLAVLVILPD